MRSRHATDYLIVGGGSAGCVLANRLSAAANCHVTLIEAGDWDRSPFIRMPAGFIQLMRSGKFDWHYHTEPEEHLDGRQLFWPRGKVIGGSSAINGMIYVRGHPSDYDRWAQYGNRGWSYPECLPYFQKSESWQDGADDVHGGSGPLQTSRHGIRHPIAKAFVEAGVEAGYPYNPDFNSGEQLGFGPCDSTIGGGRRSSASEAFLHPARSRPNLTIITRALATRILVERGRAVGLEVVRDNQIEILRAEREVILSGGVINSPQLLQLSGIGNGDHLRHIGVEVIHELNGVGQNLQDHPVATIKQGIRQPISLSSQIKPLKAATALARYALFKSGPAAHHGIQALGFVKTTPDLIAPDIQYHLLLVMYDDHGRNVADTHGFMPFFNLSRPESRGTVLLKSGDPKVQPAIRANYFGRYEDLRAMREGFKITRNIIAQKAFDLLRDQEYSPGAEVRTDQEIEAYLRRTVQSVYHPVGTCKMGSDPLAVVDDRLCVHGIDGLRVVDASIMPTLTSGNTNAPTIMIAEKAADMILNPRESEP